MKAIVKKLRKFLIGSALLGVAACNEPVGQALNPNAQPAVDLLVFRDSIAYQGIASLNTAEKAADNLDVGTFSQINASTTNLDDTTTPFPDDPIDTGYIPNTSFQLPDGANTNDVTVTTPVYPFNHPRIQFNKLIDGDTLETTSKDAGTGRQLGDCGAEPNTLDMTYGKGVTTDVPSLYACYSPSDRLVTAEPEDSNGNPLLFLQYNTPYTFTASNSIKDKNKLGLTPYSVNFTTGPFELLYVTDASNSTIVWAAESTGISVDTTPGDANQVTLPSDTQMLQFIFSGPVTRSLPVDSTGAPVNPNAAPAGTDGFNAAVDPTPTLNNYVLPIVTADDQGGAEVTATDGTTTDRAQFGVSFPLASDKAADLATNDPRVLILYHPNFLLTSGAGATGTNGFECQDQTPKATCNFTVHIPNTFTDNASVSGTAEPLAIPSDELNATNELAITFTIQNPDASSR